MTTPTITIISPIFSDILYICRTGCHGGRMTDEILTIREVAELLKINQKTAYKLASVGKIPGFKVSGSWRFERQEIANWIKHRVEKQQGAMGSDKPIPLQITRPCAERKAPSPYPRHCESGCAQP